MIRRMNSSSVGVVIDEDTAEDYNIQFCSTCAANGVMSKLKERLYLDSAGKRLATPPPDAEDWLQCWTCGNVVALRDIKKLGKISGIQGIEPTDNKFDYGKCVILGNDSKHRYCNLKKQKAKHPDKEVQKLIDDGYEVTSYLSSMPT